MWKAVLSGLFALGLVAPVTAQVSGQGGPIRVKADRSEVLDKERKVVLIDNVDITQGDARLRANVVTIEYANRQGAADRASSPTSNFGDIKSMTARGEVFYVTPELKATGGLGFYDAATDTITLTENVVLVRGEDVAKGERLVMELAAGKTSLDGGNGRIDMVIIPREGNGR